MSMSNIIFIFFWCTTSSMYCLTIVKSNSSLAISCTGMGMRLLWVSFYLFIFLFHLFFFHLFFSFSYSILFFFLIWSFSLFFLLKIRLLLFSIHHPNQMTWAYLLMINQNIATDNCIWSNRKMFFINDKITRHVIDPISLKIIKKL